MKKMVRSLLTAPFLSLRKPELIKDFLSGTSAGTRYLVPVSIFGLFSMIK